MNFTTDTRDFLLQRKEELTHIIRQAHVTMRETKSEEEHEDALMDYHYYGEMLDEVNAELAALN